MWLTRRFVKALPADQKLRIGGAGDLVFVYSRSRKIASM